MSWAAVARFASSSAERICVPGRTPDRSHAVPTPQPVPNSAMVPPRVAASVANRRPVSLRQNDTYPARRETSKARETIAGTSGGALMHRVSQIVRAIPVLDGVSRIVGQVAKARTAPRQPPRLVAPCGGTSYLFAAVAGPDTR